MAAAAKPHKKPLGKKPAPKPELPDELPDEESDQNPIGVSTITAEELCGYTGLTDRRHRQLAKAGYFPPPLRGRYQRDKSIAGLFQYLREQLNKRDDTEKIERGKLAKVKRETGEEELAIIRKKYVLKSDIAPALRNVSLHQRATLQLKLENELAPTLSGKTTAEILAAIRDAVDAICKIFNEGTRTWMDSAP